MSTRWPSAIFIFPTSSRGCSRVQRCGIRCTHAGVARALLRSSRPRDPAPGRRESRSTAPRSPPSPRTQRPPLRPRLAPDVSRVGARGGAKPSKPLPRWLTFRGFVPWRHVSRFRLVGVGVGLGDVGAEEAGRVRPMKAPPITANIEHSTQRRRPTIAATITTGTAFERVTLERVQVVGRQEQHRRRRPHTRSTRPEPSRAQHQSHHETDRGERMEAVAETLGSEQVSHRGARCARGGTRFRSANPFGPAPGRPMPGPLNANEVGRARRRGPAPARPRPPQSEARCASTIGPPRQRRARRAGRPSAGRAP